MEKYRNYLYDLGLILKERALEAKQERDAARDQVERDYLSGRLMAFNEVLSILQQQARGFEIPLSELRLDDIDPRQRPALTPIGTTRKRVNRRKNLSACSSR